MSDSETLASAPVNWSNFLDQVRRDYETEPARGLAHGLQKDAIQNGWGARVGDREWSFEFALHQGPNGKLLLTMTDAGTTGLIGQVFDYAKDLPPEFPEKEKLARFECMFDSGGGIGPGLFGRGKLLFNAASQQQLIFYDSYTLDKQYRVGRRQIKGRNCDQLRRVLEGENARRLLKEWTGNALSPLARPGTRITIVDPISEVVSAIHDGSFLKAIEETWWEIIKKHDARVLVTDEKGKSTQARVPEEFHSIPQRNVDGWRVYYRQNEAVEIGDSKFRIKHLHFLLPPGGQSLPLALLGVSVYRRGMKIGPLQLSDIPPEINERFFGYAQLMPDFEALVAEAENTTHYGFGSLRKPAIRSLRKTVQDHLDLFMQELGYRKAGGDPDEKAKRILEEAREDLDDILSNMGVPGFGTGRQNEPGISISVKSLRFPDDSNYISLGTELSDFWYLIRNTTMKPKVIDVEVFTHERDIGKIETILEPTRHTIPPEKEFATTKIWAHFKSGVYPKGRKIGVTARVSDENGNRLAQKTFFVYLEMAPEPEEELAAIELRAVDWPRLNSRRVDYDQSLSNLVYELENRTPLNMRARLKVRTLTSEREPIDNVSDSDMELEPMESKELSIEKITMLRVKYQDVRRGKMILRCHAVALENTKKWEKGFRLAEHNISFYLNMDPSYGFFEDPVYFDGGPMQPRSEAQPVQGSAGIRLWTIRINKTHPAYISAQADETRQKNYLFEEMARQTVYVLLRKGQFDPIRKLIDLQAIDAIDKMEPEDILQSVAYRVTDRIVAEYYRS